MKKISDLLDDMESIVKNKVNEQLREEITETDILIVDKLFQTFIHIFPAFKQAWPTQTDFNHAKREWVKAFKQVGIRDFERLKRGVEHYRLLPTPFVPSPGQFIAMCKLAPTDLGAPDLENAYREACMKSHPAYGNNKQWSHACVKWAARQTTSHTLTSLSREKSFPVFEDYYEQALNLYEAGQLHEQLEDKQAEDAERARQQGVVLEQYKQSRGFGDALRLLKGGK